MRLNWHRPNVLPIKYDPDSNRIFVQENEKNTFHILKKICVVDLTVNKTQSTSYCSLKKDYQLKQNLDIYPREEIRHCLLCLIILNGNNFL